MTIKLDRGVMPIKYQQGKVMLLDQRALPKAVLWVDATGLTEMCDAISNMTVRGAPSIGVAAAFGLACQASRIACDYDGSEPFLAELDKARRRLQATRPTAVNLRWGLEEVYSFIEENLCGTCGETPALIAASDSAVNFAQEMLERHVADNMKLSEFGAALVPDNANIITHCNAGPLATSGWGTALGVIRTAAMHGKKIHVYADETRPRNQGAKLTMWELHEDKIDATLICDSMSGHVMSSRKIDLVVVGADRIAANGDTANKIGTYNLAVVANFHNVPFYVAAPLSTIDPHISSGAQIPIEERDSKEVTTLEGLPTTVEGARAYNPAFDVTPHELITGIITETGVLAPPYTESIKSARGKADGN